MSTVTTKSNEAPLVHQRIGCWIETDFKTLPPGYLVVGKDLNRSVGIIRTHYKNKLYIGKFVEGLGVYFPDGDTEVKIKKDKDFVFQIFCHSQLRWEAWNGKAPPYAFVAGRTEDAKEFYIGKTTIAGNVVVGGIRDNILYCTWGKAVYKSNTFEVLVLDFCTHLRDCLA